MSKDSTGQAGATDVVTQEMIEAALAVYRDWQESDEPDDRTMVVGLLEAALRERGPSS